MSDGPAAGSHILLPCHLFHHLRRRHIPGGLSRLMSPFPVSGAGQKVYGRAHNGLDRSETGPQHGQVFHPGSDRRRILAPHHSGDLAQVAQVMSNPSRQKLAQGHWAELGVKAPPLEIRSL